MEVDAVSNVAYNACKSSPWELASKGHQTIVQDLNCNDQLDTNFARRLQDR